MRRNATIFLLGFALLGGCSDSDNGAGPGAIYDLSTTQTSLEIGQDSTRQLVVTVMRDGNVAIDNPRITYTSDDLSVAAVSATGLVTAKKGGQTIVRASFNGKTLEFPVTVIGRPATAVHLTLNFTGRDSGTVFALPGLGSSAFLRAVVLAGNDTVYCNALACTNHATRPGQRIVEFLSLKPEKAVIANSTASTTALNNRGQVTATDTSANYVGFVLRVPADNIADTVWLRLTLRPVDILTVRTDSFTVAGTTTRLAYSSVITRDSSIVLGVNMQSRSDSAYSLLTSGPRRLLTTVNVVRPNLPRVTWESANDNYAVIDNQGRVTGLRSTWFGGTNANTNDAPSCSTAVFKVSPADTAYAYDRVLTRFPIPSNYTPAVVATGCATTTGVPANVARGVNCASATATITASCTVVIRATITDPATGNVRQAYFTVLVRQP